MHRSLLIVMVLHVRYTFRSLIQVVIQKLVIKFEIGFYLDHLLHECCRSQLQYKM